MFHTLSSEVHTTIAHELAKLLHPPDEYDHEGEALIRSSIIPLFGNADLVNLALTCRALEQPALAVLWREVDCRMLPPLAMTMHAPAWTLVDDYGRQYVEMTEANCTRAETWLSPRFQFYARCVRKVNFKRLYRFQKTFVRSSVLDVWAAHAKEHRLFPGLRSLSHSITDEAHPGLIRLAEALRAERGILELTLFFDSLVGLPSFTNSIMSSFTDDGTRGSRHLRSLTIIDATMTPGLDSFDLRDLSTLLMTMNPYELELDIKLGEGALQTIAALANLQKLTYNHCRSGYDEKPTAPLMAGFAALTSLEFSAANMEELLCSLNSISTERLQNLHCSLVSSMTTHDSLLSICKALKRWCSSLTTFRLVPNEIYVETDHILPVTASTLIEVLNVFKPFSSLRSIGLDTIEYQRSDTAAQDERDGRAVVSAYGELVTEVSLAWARLPPMLFLPLYTRFARCTGGEEVSSGEDVDFLIDAAEKRGMGGDYIGLTAAAAAALAIARRPLVRTTRVWTGVKLSKAQRGKADELLKTLRECVAPADELSWDYLW